MTFDEFFAEQRNPLLAQAFALSGNREEAQDLVQEVFSRVWQRWDQVAQMSNPSGWARTVLFNLAMGRYRRLRTQARHVQSVVPEVTRDEAAHIDLARALRSLPEKQRAALILHHVVGMPVVLVATEMSSPEGSVRGWLSKGRQTLAKKLAVDSERKKEGTKQ
jgi:RNA polymerase sigma-70 factor, ECF subfamily